MSELSIDQLMEVQAIKLLRDLDDLNGLFEIMVYLEKFERGTISNFIKDLGLNQQPVYRTLEKLRTLGLIRLQQKLPAGRRKVKSKYYFLTTAGQALAQHIAAFFEAYRGFKEAANAPR